MIRIPILMAGLVNLLKWILYDQDSHLVVIKIKIAICLASLPLADTELGTAQPQLVIDVFVMPLE